MKKLIAILLITLSGCGPAMFLAAPIGAIIQGVIIWKDGEAVKYFSYKPEILYRATKKAAEDLNLKINKDQYNNSTYSLVVGDNDKFSISIKEEEPGISSIKIRVNFLGDKPYAELLYNKIDENIDFIRYSEENGAPVKQKPRSFHRRNT